MIIGECIATDSICFTPWFESQGDAATFYIDIQARMANAQVSAWVHNKNKEDADSAAVVATGGAFTPTSTTGVIFTRATSLLELVRLRIHLLDTAEGESWVHLRVVQPSWETN